MKLLVINGANLNFLGLRETNIYGEATYLDLVDFLQQIAKKHNIALEIFQTNHEGAIVDKLQEAYHQKFDGIIINPGAYTHYSYAIRDAISSVNIKCVEVHLSNIYNREDFRKISVVKDVCIASFYGKGFESYKEAMLFLNGE